MIDDSNVPSNWGFWTTVWGGIVTAAGLLWHFIDRSFKDKSEERQQFIQSVVKQAMETAMEPIHKHLNEMRDEHRSDIKDVHKRIDELFKENRK